MDSPSVSFKFELRLSAFGFVNCQLVLVLMPAILIAIIFAVFVLNGNFI